MTTMIENESETRSLVVNGQVCKASAATLGDLLAELGYGGQKVATALNGAFVAERLRSSTDLSPDDHIEIVAPRQGG